MLNKQNGPVVVTLDIETSPLMGYTWGIWEQNVIEVVKRSSVLCASWKFLGDSKVHNVAQCDAPDYKPGVENDRFVMQALRDVLDQADIVVTQNGDAFDIPIIRTRLFELGIEPFSPVKRIDTKKLAKSMFRFESNKLEHMVQYASIASKTNPGGFGAWKGCMRGDKKSWADMIKYNNNDVLITEQLYLKMRPYMETHPNLNIIADRLDACKFCLNDKLQARGWGYNNASKYRRFQCTGPKGCGAWNKGVNIPTKDLAIK
jgi:hypothetical protein